MSTRSSARTFPSITISDSGIVANGSFAENQAMYLKPDEAVVARLDALVAKKKLGIVAHFYMDPELQGVLSSMVWPHTVIADSLAMGEAATKMAAEGVKAIAVLGVDFMSESVRANLDANGYSHVPVYRLREQKIGCSLAEAAERPAYGAYLTHAAAHPHALHVVYINTSLKSKAFAHHLIPTITCTSSNVVQTILSAFAQLPSTHLFYGPDTYMGHNLHAYFQYMATALSDREIASIHPAHSKASLHHVLSRFNYFKQGTCIVHHLFNAQVTETVRTAYPNAYITAHFEVPGEMFALAMAARASGRGVVGSTSNILDFITAKTTAAMAAGSSDTLSFILGTEAGMITSIVRGVERVLQDTPLNVQGQRRPRVEIIFPVASDAIATTEDPELTIVPGAASGEGCSISGGCATCPFMKMNDLDALLHVAETLEEEVVGQTPPSTTDALGAYRPATYTETIQGHSLSTVGSVPILHMKAFIKEGKLSDALLSDVTSRVAGAGCPEVQVHTID